MDKDHSKYHSGHVRSANSYGHRCGNRRICPVGNDFGLPLADCGLSRVDVIDCPLDIFGHSSSILAVKESASCLEGLRHVRAIRPSTCCPVSNKHQRMVSSDQPHTQVKCSSANLPARCFWEIADFVKWHLGDHQWLLRTTSNSVKLDGTVS